jgi:hypothetical protein
MNMKDECGMEIRIVGLPFRNPRSAFPIRLSFLPIVVLERFGTDQPALR